MNLDDDWRYPHFRKPPCDDTPESAVDHDHQVNFAAAFTAKSDELDSLWGAGGCNQVRWATEVVSFIAGLYSLKNLYWMSMGCSLPLHELHGPLEIERTFRYLGIKPGEGDGQCTEKHGMLG